MNTFDNDDFPAPAAPSTTILQSTLSPLWKFLELLADDMPGESLAVVVDLRKPVDCKLVEDDPPDDIVALDTPGWSVVAEAEFIISGSNR